MPKTHISRSKIINAPVEAVYNAVADLKAWQAWSPWLIMDPEAEVSIANDKQSYSWEGMRVGAGHMSITEATPNTSARYDLTFLKPFKSTAKVGMDVKAIDGGTEVTWTMHSQLPFFMFFMKNMMETYIGMDYERGLTLLDDYVKDGKVHSRLNFHGISDYAGCDYVGIERSSSINNMPSLMEEDFGRLAEWALKNGLGPEKMFSIYHKFDPLKDQCHYTAAIPVSDNKISCPDDFTRGSQAPTKLYTLEHVGPYEHLGNAWSTIHSIIRAKEIKPIKNYHPFETYGNSPKDTNPHDLITRINFAVQ